jgi:hypothetical protein
MILVYYIYIGYAKYSLESIDMDNMNLLNHYHKSDIVWRTRRFGSIEFTANYKF